MTGISRHSVSSQAIPSRHTNHTSPTPWRATGLSIALLATTLASQTFDLTITPPPTLTLNGQSITQGQFTLAGATAYSDPAGILTTTMLLDPGDPGDDVSITGVIGSGSINFLISVPEATELIRVQGNFKPTVPNLPAHAFDATIGTVSVGGPTEYIWYLPQTSTQTLQFQVTDLGGPTLVDNIDLFSPAPPVVALSATDPALSGLTVLTLANGETNPWFLGVPSALPRARRA